MIFAAVYYDVLLIFHDVNILLVYMLICLHRGPQGRIAITAKRVTLLKHCINKINKIVESYTIFILRFKHYVFDSYF